MTRSESLSQSHAEKRISEIFEEMERAHLAFDARAFFGFFAPGFSDWSDLENGPDFGITEERIATSFAREKAEGKKAPVEVRDLSIKTYGDTVQSAVATFFFVGTFYQKDGKGRPGAWRCSSVWAVVAGDWKLTHLHTSPLHGSKVDQLLTTL